MSCWQDLCSKDLALLNFYISFFPLLSLEYTILGEKKKKPTFIHFNVMLLCQALHPVLKIQMQMNDNYCSSD